MLHWELAAEKRFTERDVLLDEEVVAPALELVVRLEVEHDNQITGFGSWRFIRAALENDPFAVLHAWLDVNGDELLLADDFLTLACLALVLFVNAFASTPASWASCNLLSDHWAHADDLDTLTTAVAILALCWFLAVGAASTLALSADDVAIDFECHLLAVVEVLKGDVDLVADILGALPARLTPSTKAAEAAEEMRQDVVHTASHSTLLETLGTILIVKLTALRVLQNLIGLVDLLELFSGIGIVAILVRVEFPCLLHESLLQITITDAGIDAKEIIKLRVTNHFDWSKSAVFKSSGRLPKVLKLLNGLQFDSCLMPIFTGRRENQLAHPIFREKCLLV